MELIDSTHVLIFCGAYDYTGHIQRQCEIYDITTGTWALGPLYPLVRNTKNEYCVGVDFAYQNKLALRLSDGRILIAGGSIDDIYQITRETQVYSGGVSGSWAYAGMMTSHSRDHILVELADGRVIRCGGIGSDGNPTPNCCLWDGTTTWTPTGTMTATARLNFAGCRLVDGRVLVSGGSGIYGASLSSAEIWNPSTELWTAVASMQKTREFHYMFRLPNGNIVVIEGDKSDWLGTAEVYNVAENTWTLLTQLNYEHKNMPAIVPLFE